MPIQSYPTPYGGQLTTGSQAWANGGVAGFHHQGPNGGVRQGAVAAGPGRAGGYYQATGPNGGQRTHGFMVGPNGAMVGRHVQGPNGNQATRGAVYNRAEDTLTLGRQAVIGGQTYQRHRTIQLP